MFALALWRNFDATATGLQFVERHAWIPAIGAEYLRRCRWLESAARIAHLANHSRSHFSRHPPNGSRGFCALMLVMQSALYGTFTAQNFVLWFLFYEMSLIPAFSAHQNLGWRKSGPRRDEVFPLHVSRKRRDVAFVPRDLFRQGHVRFRALWRLLERTACLTGNVAWLAFAGIFLGLAVKVPLFPFHTWLPDAYETAPDRRVDGAHGRALEDGRLRFRPPVASALP